MRKFVFRVICFLIFACVVFSCVFAANKYYVATDDYNLEFSVKADLIKQTPRPKIVFVGGSNLAFGLDSKTISDSLRLPVVNAGLVAGIGMRYILDSYAPLFQKGDIVVVMPEYDHFFGATMNGNPETLGSLPYMKDFNPWILNWAQAQNVLKGFPKYTLQVFVKNLALKVQNSFVSQKVVKYAYTKSGFNRYGDEVSHWKLLPNGTPTYPLGVIGDFNTDYLDHFVRQISNLRKRGVRVLVLPPATSLANYELNKPKIGQLSEQLSRQNMGYTVPPRQLTYPDSMLYNTCYHLNKAGVDVNTGRIIRILKGSLKPLQHTVR